MLCFGKYLNRSAIFPVHVPDHLVPSGFIRAPLKGILGTSKGALGQGVLNVCAIERPLGQGALNVYTTKGALGQGTLNVCTTKGALKKSSKAP